MSSENSYRLQPNIIDGKVAVITGASKGIGKAIATALGEAGVKVVLAARTQSTLEKVVDELTKEGGGCFTCTNRCYR